MLPRRLLMALIATMAGLLILNVAAFLGELALYGTWYTGDRPAGLYVSDSSLRPRLQPGARLRGLRYSISVNSLGFRGPELVEPKPEDGVRIWCMGGSTTFDIYAPDDARTWPAVAGQRVAGTLLGKQVEVLNAGVPGETLGGSVEDLRAMGPRVRPDVVVVYHGPNDLRTMAPPTMVLKGPGPMGLPDLALTRVVGRTFQERAWSRVDLPSKRIQPHQLAGIRSHLAEAIAVSRELGARPVLVTHGLRAPPGTSGEEARRLVAEAALLLQRDPESTIQAFDAYNALVREVALQEGLTLVDLRRELPADAALWGDATHFLAPGSELAGELVARGVLEALEGGG